MITGILIAAALVGGTGLAPWGSRKEICSGS